MMVPSSLLNGSLRNAAPLWTVEADSATKGND